MNAKKQWFIKIDQQHVGPFSFDQLQEKLNSNQITLSSLVRSTDSEVWSPLQDIMTGRPSSAAPINDGPEPMRPKNAIPDELSAFIHLKPVQTDASKIIDKSLLQSASNDENKANIINKTETKAKNIFKKILGFLIFVIIILASIAGFFTYQKYFPAFPKLEDVDATAYQELKSTLKLDLEKNGAKISFALSNRSLEKPVFHFSTNLPDKTEFEFILNPKPKTLLVNSLGELKQKLVSNKHYATTNTVEYPGGAELPIGEYVAIIKQFPENKILLQADIFLGGKNTESYKATLLEYHEKLKSTFLHTFDPFKDLSNHLINLAAESTRQKLEISKKPLKVRNNLWNTFHTKKLAEFNKIQQTLDESHSKSTYKYFTELWQLSSDALKSVQNLHELHHKFFVQKINPSLYNIQLNQQMIENKNILETFKNKSEDIFKSINSSEDYLEFNSTTGGALENSK